MKAIFKLNVYVDRQGDLIGTFVAEKEHVRALIDNKIKVHFGEVLGKHSDVCGALDDMDIIMISDDTDAVRLFEDLKLHCGHNPFYYDTADGNESALDAVMWLLNNVDQ